MCLVYWVSSGVSVCTAHNLMKRFIQVLKGRSLSMRQSSTSRRAYNDYGHLPKNSTPSSRTTPARSGGSSVLTSPDIVINGHSNDDSSADSVGSASRHRGVPENARLGSAANPNRSDMPDMGRRKPHEQTSSLVSVYGYMRWLPAW